MGLAAEEAADEGATEGAIGGDGLGVVDVLAVGRAVAGFFVGLGEPFGGLLALEGAAEAASPFAGGFGWLGAEAGPAREALGVGPEAGTLVESGEAPVPGDADAEGAGCEEGEDGERDEDEERVGGLADDGFFGEGVLDGVGAAGGVAVVGAEEFFEGGLDEGVGGDEGLAEAAGAALGPVGGGVEFDPSVRGEEDFDPAVGVAFADGVEGFFAGAGGEDVADGDAARDADGAEHDAHG